jgi:hypothetical protein
VIPAQPGTISGESNPIIDSTYNYEILPVIEAETYNWNATGGTVTGDSNTVPVKWTSLGGQSLSVEAVNNCGASNATILDVNVINSVTGIAYIAENSIKIYPNPFKDEIYIGLDNSDEILNIEVYNTLGVKIKEVKNLHLSHTILNMTEIKEGLYSLIIYTKNGRVIKSAIKY